MKKPIIIILLLLTAIGCKEDKKNSTTKVDESTNTNNWGTFLTATINGEEFSSSVKVVTFTANNQTYLTTADNSDPSEFAFNLIIENNNDQTDQKIKRYGFVEKEDENEKVTWKLPDNFDFTGKLTESGKYLEGTFSFTANAFDKGMEDSTNQLVVTDVKFKAFKTQ
ncbi:hypothetical protein JBL43_07035 [Aureibaculum sp. A20]|uniref:Lipocalin-like domain-containing protein n=1 Tax=Aureibaculum flavum TaxID=2795986 RepID=A0ABS0WPS5_9FLAO|nr:hypothetical protein [Aureibaculum flavum]MBJ2173985.1 hypothetical protein [Aureibaculum flavum]